MTDKVARPGVAWSESLASDFCTDADTIDSVHYIVDDSHSLSPSFPSWVDTFPNDDTTRFIAGTPADANQGDVGTIQIECWDTYGAK